VPCREPCQKGVMYETQACTATTDRECAVCAVDCPFGQYKKIRCENDHDATCANCTIINSCPNRTWQTSTCSGDHDGECTPCRERCAVGEFQTYWPFPDHTPDRQCTLFHDIQCDACTWQCRPHMSVGFYMASNCSEFADSKCVPCASCANRQVRKLPFFCVFFFTKKLTIVSS
jgi:hypothetical protein